MTEREKKRLKELNVDITAEELAITPRSALATKKSPKKSLVKIPTVSNKRKRAQITKVEIVYV